MRRAGQGQFYANRARTRAKTETGLGGRRLSDGPTMGAVAGRVGRPIQDVDRGRLCTVKPLLGWPGGGVAGVWYWKTVTEVELCEDE